jgi:hypothetical protein
MLNLHRPNSLPEEVYQITVYFVAWAHVMQCGPSFTTTKRTPLLGDVRHTERDELYRTVGAVYPLRRAFA